MAENKRSAQESSVEGLVSHIELLAKDVSSTAEFYSKVLGWTCQEYELDGKPYMGWMCPDGGIPGGFRELPQNLSPSIINYVKTFDIDAVLKKIIERGGTILLEKSQIKGIGHIAWFRDPFGNTLGLFQPE